MHAFQVDTVTRTAAGFRPGSDQPPGVCAAVPFLPTGDNATVVIVAGSNGVVRHWHATSGKSLGAPIVEADNGVFALDVRSDGGTFATAGRDGGVRVYDERTGKLVVSLRGGTDADETDVFPGHGNRVFGLRYLDACADVLVSGGWLLHRGIPYSANRRIPKLL